MPTPRSMFSPTPTPNGAAARSAGSRMRSKSVCCWTGSARHAACTSWTSAAATECWRPGSHRAAPGSPALMPRPTCSPQDESCRRRGRSGERGCWRPSISRGALRWRLVCRYALLCRRSSSGDPRNGARAPTRRPADPRRARSLEPLGGSAPREGLARSRSLACGAFSEPGRSACAGNRCRAQGRHRHSSRFLPPARACCEGHGADGPMDRATDNGRRGISGPERDEAARDKTRNGADMTGREGQTPPILAHKHPDEPSAFTPESLLREARRQKGAGAVAVPKVCLLDPDGDIVRQLRVDGRARRHEGWVCYHTDMWCSFWTV